MDFKSKKHDYNNANHKKVTKIITQSEIKRKYTYI